MGRARRVGSLLALAAWAGGCCHPKVTAHRLLPDGGCCCEESGIPFYLPKPLLIVAKNFRYVEEAKVGLTDGAPIPNGFDDQSKYADVNARTSFSVSTGGGGGGSGGGGAKAETDAGGKEGGNAAPAATASGQHIYSNNPPNVVFGSGAPSDGLKPDVFYTYQIVFVPDLSQKFGLKIKGGVGEMRAALNLVNGWQFTGLGPYYLKDSSTAQNILASGITANLAGRGLGDVIKSLTSLRAGGGGASPEALIDAAAKLANLRQAESYAPLGPTKIADYAEIHVLEPYLTPEGQMEWREIYSGHFDRDVVAALQWRGTGDGPKVETRTTIVAPAAPAAPPPPHPGIPGTPPPAAAPAPTGPALPAAAAPAAESAVTVVQPPEVAILNTLAKAAAPVPGMDAATFQAILARTLPGAAPAAPGGPTAEAAVSRAVPAAAPGGTVNQININCKDNCGFCVPWVGKGKAKHRPVVAERDVDAALGALPAAAPANPAVNYPASPQQPTTSGSPQQTPPRTENPPPKG
jgi:hypothetical protein